MTGRHDPYVRLLRWYPKAWRDANGAVWVDTLREQSEAEGWSRPSRGEAVAAVVNGLGTRLDARAAAQLALGGIAVRAAVEVTMQIASPGGISVQDPALNGLVWIFLSAFAIPVFGGLVALSRSYGVLSPRRALAVLAAGAVGICLFAAAMWASAYGFQLADDNPALARVASAAIPLGAAALAIGATAGWLVVDGMLSRTRLRRLPRAALSLVAGVVLAGLAGYATMMTLGWVTVGVTVVGLSMRSLGGWSSVEPRVVVRSRLSLVRTLAGISAAISMLGIGYAVTAPAWSPLAENPTTAVVHAILVLLVGALPLVVALGLLAPRPRLHVWGPVALVLVAMAATFYGYTDAPLSTRIDSSVPIGSLALGLSLAWWVTARLATSRGDRLMAGIAITLACVVWHLAALLPVAVFVLPLVAGVLAVRGTLARREPIQAVRTAPVTDR